MDGRVEGWKEREARETKMKGRKGFPRIQKVQISHLMLVPS